MKKLLLIGGSALCMISAAAAVVADLSASGDVELTRPAIATGSSSAATLPAGDWGSVSLTTTDPGQSGAQDGQPTLAETPAPVLRIGYYNTPVTTDELDSFVDYIATLVPANDNIGNQWAQGKSGEAVKAMGLVYEFSRRTEILNRMIVFCDTVLSERNDLAPAPVGQYVIWTGKVAPVWPNDVSDTPIGTGGEQGDPVGHLANCARLILQTPALYNLTVPDGNPFGYGVTYLDRAKRYVKEADYSIDNHILSELVNLNSSGNAGRQYFAANNPYMSNVPVPWNQQFMFNYAFQNLAKAHEILGVDAARSRKYKTIVRNSMSWFFTAGVRSFTTPKGNPAYEWGYTMPNKTGEDNSHGSLDYMGFYRTYMTNEYGITADQMTRMGNIVMDVMMRSETSFAGRLNGTTGSGNSGATTYLRPGYMFIAQFRPNDYETIMRSARMAQGTTTTILDAYSRYLWVKNKRNGMEQ